MGVKLHRGFESRPLRPALLSRRADSAAAVSPTRSRALKLVTEWVSLHRVELEAGWEQAKQGSTPEAIEPLP
jgi:hypothetical protein